MEVRKVPGVALLVNDWGNVHLDMQIEKMKNLDNEYM